MSSISSIFAGIASFFTTFTLASLLPAIITLVAGYFLIKLAVKIFNTLIVRTKVPATVHVYLRTTIRFTLWALVIIIAASSLGFDVTSLVAILSVASLAVSLAVQGALSNLSGGLSVLTTQPFQAGDFVEIGGVSGVVEEVGVAYTKLMTLDNKVIHVPNSEVAATKIINYSSATNRRVDIQISASYDAPVDTVLDALKNACLLPLVLTDPAPFVAVNNYGESAIVYDVRVWTESANYWDVFYGLTYNVKVKFDECGIAMTYPHINVHMAK